MTTAALPSIDTPDLRVRVTEQDGGLRVHFVGNADTRAMAPLETLLCAMHDAALRSATREVAVDLRELEFMNSSCFKTFVTWIVKVQELATDKQYTLRFLSDENKHWQRRSLGALSCFAVDLIKIETHWSRPSNSQRS
jgi:hypothetical protein